MIHTIAFIRIKPGGRERFLEIFHALVPEVLAEEGCLAYGPTVDVDAGLGDVQVGPDENMVTVVEQWESVPHLQAHLAAPHMDRFREEAGELIESLTVRVVEPA
ncbi:MAG: putative quinol monooxygenase [Phycisphaeraceae bacterium]